MPKKRAGNIPLPPGGVLLDSHVWLWYLDGNETAIANRVADWLEGKADHNDLLISEMSVWEIANKASKGRLTLLPTAELWITNATAQPGFRFLAPTRDILLLSTKLPGFTPDHPADPVDRMLIATSLLHRRPLVTADEQIIRYQAVNPYFNVVDIRRGT